MLLIIGHKKSSLLFKIETYPIATHMQTGEVINAQPTQYSVTTEPFQIAIDNIMGIAKATSETIDEWQKYNIKLKLECLSLYTNRISINNTRWAFYINLLTVLLAISLSVFFLIANDPFNLYKEKRNLNFKIMTLEQENNILKSKIEKPK